jgi:hypothetical protein
MYALAAFAAADETPESDWSSGWHDVDSRRGGVTADRADGR